MIWLKLETQRRLLRATCAAKETTTCRNEEADTFAMAERIVNWSQFGRPIIISRNLENVARLN